MKVTLRHAFLRKITHIYPFEKPKLPERSRGLIQLIHEPETGELKCEACLLCEKVCPPRAITISYSPRNAFRRRPLFRPKTQSAFYRPRMSTPAPYVGRPPSSVLDLRGTDVDPRTIGVQVERVLSGLSPDADVMEALVAVQDKLGYLPEEAARRISETLEVPLSDLFAAATLNPAIRLHPAVGPNPTTGLGESDRPEGEGGRDGR